jgi:hypothetical protein
MCGRFAGERMDDFAGDGGLPEVELCHLCGEPSEGIDIDVLSLFGELFVASSSACGRLGAPDPLLAEQLSLPEEPGRLGESSRVAKSCTEVFSWIGDSMLKTDLTAGCDSATGGFAGDTSSAPDTAGLRTEPRP